MRSKKPHDPEMTERQYKTLRKLLSLWIAVVVRRKYTIFQNVLLIGSIALNGFLFFYRGNSVQPTIAATVLAKGVNIEQAMDLSNYQSVSDPDKTLMSRYNKIYKGYIDDKSEPDRIHYLKSGRVDSEWYQHCKKQLVKIINIKNRIKAVENILLKTYPEKTDEIYQTSNKNEESLADMSNYYSKFLPTEVYDSIVKSFD